MEMVNFTKWHTSLKKCFNYFHTENLLLFRKGFTLPVDFFVVLFQGLCNVLIINFPFLYSRCHSKRLLGIFINPFLGFIVFGLLCLFALFTLFFPTGGGFLIIFLIQDKSDGVGAFSTLSNKNPIDVCKDELLTLSKQAFLQVEFN